MTKQLLADPAKEREAAPTAKPMSSNHWMETSKFLLYEVAARQTSNQYMKYNCEVPQH